MANCSSCTSALDRYQRPDYVIDTDTSGSFRHKRGARHRAPSLARAQAPPVPGVRSERAAGTPRMQRPSTGVSLSQRGSRVSRGLRTGPHRAQCPLGGGDFVIIFINYSALNDVERASVQKLALERTQTRFMQDPTPRPAASAPRVTFYETASSQKQRGPSPFDPGAAPTHRGTRGKRPEHDQNGSNPNVV